jgi:hypothetical protein
MQKQFTVTPAQMLKFRTEAAANGLSVPAADSGQVTIPAHGIVMGYAYDGTTLTITGISKTDWFPTWGMVFGELQNYLS